MDASAKRVGIWIRVSTEDQAQGESPEHHEKRARAYAEFKGWNVIELYQLSGLSGKSVLEYDEAKRMLADIREGRIEGLIFSKLARLGRNTRELLDISELFRKAGADLISLQEAIDTSTPAGRMFYTMLAALAQWEREEIASRVAASVPIRAKLGKTTGGRAPFGYRHVDKRLVVDPDEAPVRRLMFELFAEHQRKRTVARLLNERGYRTRVGGKWTGGSVLRLVADPVAKGLHRQNYTRTDDNKKAWSLKPESDWVMTPVEAIVSDELWDRCNAILEAQKAKVKPVSRSTVHLFAGLARCHCGTKMYVRAGSPKYVCEGCRNKIPTADLEAVFLSELRRFLVSPEEIAAHGRATAEAIREKERLVERSLADLKKLDIEEDALFALHREGGVRTEDFGRRFAPLSERRRQLDDELPRLQTELDVMRISAASQEEAISGAKTLTEGWSALSAAQKRQMIEATTNHIVIGTEEIEIDLISLPLGSSDKSAPQRQGFCAATSWNRAG